MNPLQGTAPVGITVTVGGNAVDLGKGTITCTPADSALRLVALSSAVFSSIYMFAWWIYHSNIYNK